MKVLICGGRDYDDEAYLFNKLDAINARSTITTIIHGAARGADSLADKWARSRRVRINVYPADWVNDGAGAGPKRNRRMLKEGRPDLVVAFPGGRGTADMVRRSNGAGIAVLEIKEQ